MQEDNKHKFSIEEAIFRRDGFKCSCCGCHAPDVQLYIDYKNPPANGGDATSCNLVTLCRKCNGGRRNPKQEEAGKDELTERIKQSLMLIRYYQDIHKYESILSELRGMVE